MTVDTVMTERISVQMEKEEMNRREHHPGTTRDDRSPTVCDCDGTMRDDRSPAVPEMRFRMFRICVTHGDVIMTLFVCGI